MKKNFQKAPDSSRIPLDAKRAMEAVRSHSVRPALFYTEQEQTPCDAGVWETRETVNHKLKQKEEFPLG